MGHVEPATPMLRRLTSIFKTPTTLREALDYDYPRDQIQQIDLSRHLSDDLVELVADHFGESVEALLSRIAKRLKLPYMLVIPPITQSLVEKTGHTFDVLYDKGIAPVIDSSSPTGYALAISSPDNIARKDYESAQVKLYLTLAKTVADAWSEFDSRQRSFQKPVPISGSLDRVFAVVERLALQAHSCGGREIFLGHPEENTYLFLVGSKRYKGSLHPSIYNSLVKHFDVDRFRMPIPSSNKYLNKVFASVTHDTQRPVIFVSWEAFQLEPQTAHGPLPEESCIESTPFLKQEPLDSEIEATTQMSLATIATDQSDRAAHDTGEVDFEVAEIENQHVNQNSESLATAPRVLVIDDDNRFISIVSKLLSNNSLDVLSSMNPQEALEQLQSESVAPDLVVCDVHMPQLDGTQMLRALKGSLPLLPVLMLTSDNDAGLQAELASLGCDAFVNKQEDPRVLVAWCKNLCTKHHAATNSE